MMKLAIFGLFCLQAVLAAPTSQDLLENTLKKFADIFPEVMVPVAEGDKTRLKVSAIEDCLAVGKLCLNGQCCRNSDWVCCPHGPYCAINAESCPVPAASTTEHLG